MGGSGSGCSHRCTINQRTLQQHEEAWVGWQHPCFPAHPIHLQSCGAGERAWENCMLETLGEPQARERNVLSDYHPALGKEEQVFVRIIRKSSFTSLAWLPPSVGKQCWLLIDISYLAIGFLAASSFPPRPVAAGYPPFQLSWLEAGTPLEILSYLCNTHIFHT